MNIILLNEEQFRNYSSNHINRNFCQTLEYANMKNADGYKTIYLGLIDDEKNILAGSLILEKNINTKYKYGFSPNGFLIDYDNQDLIKNFTDKLKEYLKKQNYIYLRINPIINYRIYDKNLNLIEGNEKNINILRKCGFNFSGYQNNFSKYFIKLNVGDSLDDIYDNFSRSVKRNINFCLNAGLTIHKGNADNFEIFYDLIKKNSNKSMEYYRKLSSYFNTAYNKFEIFFAKLNPETYINNYQYLLKKEEENNDFLSEQFKKESNQNNTKLLNKKMLSDRLIEKYKKEIIRATNVYKIFPDGIIVGTCGIIRNNKEIYFLVDGYNEQLNYIHSLNLIKWEIIKSYHSVGYKEFSFGAVNSDLNNETYKGLLNSKLGFGGDIIEYPGDYNLTINKYLYTIYSSFSDLSKKK